jgi:SNF2 family DNA or RNA helicase
MTVLKKKMIFVFAPNRLLETVWENEIQEVVFKEKKNCFVINRDTVNPDYDFYLYNYEGIEKALQFVKSQNFKPEEIGIIVDESHNFLTLQSKRTGALLDLIEHTKCDDVLLMSGTPLKAIGSDMIPLLMMLDRYFDQEARDIFKKALGVNTTIATDILNARLNIFMHRRKKEDVLKLPPKTEIIVKVKLPNGKDYTAASVQKAMQDYAEKRFAFHKPKMNEYKKIFFDAIDWILTKTDLGKSSDFKLYLKHIESFLKKTPNMRDPVDREKVQWVNNYEKTTVIPILPEAHKKGFTSVRAAVKYLPLKVQGEVLGQCLTALRAKMTKEIAEACNLASYIREAALKKTVIFTSYVDTVEHIMGYLQKEKFKAVAVYGKTNHEVKSIITKFKKDAKVNPLVATIQSLSTGVTLTEADFMAMMNRPWRITDYLQASDRIHRIGQDSPVTIATFELDTGNEPNLSTRMADILAMSKIFFDNVVDGEEHV